jgi:hypothetical protein
MQKRLLDAYEQIQLSWLARVKSESDLWSDLVARLQEVRSGPEAFQVYQRSIVQRMQLAIADGRRVVDETERTLAILSQMISERLADPAEMKASTENETPNSQT